MSRALVIDASVAAKWFLVEHDSERAFGLLSHARLHAPHLVAVEVAAALVRRVRTGGLDIEDARRKFAFAREVFGRPVFQLTPDADLLERAAEVAFQLRHPLQDCLYLACAEQFDADVITADTTLLQRAAASFPFVKKF